VVVAGPAGETDADPVTVRVRNVTTSGFEIRLQEYEYLAPGDHPAEAVSYLVVERGHYTLASGATVEADTVTVGSSFAQVDFVTPFPQSPALFTVVSSVNDADAVHVRVRSVSAASFEARLSEGELTEASHGPESVSYVAWSYGSDDGSSDAAA